MSAFPTEILEGIKKKFSGWNCEFCLLLPISWQKAKEDDCRIL